MITTTKSVGINISVGIVPKPAKVDYTLWIRKCKEPLTQNGCSDMIIIGTNNRFIVPEWRVIDGPTTKQGIDRKTEENPGSIGKLPGK
jgi:hypothetical protein